MADLMGCFLAAASFQQFVVGPEGAIDEHQVTGFGPLLPLGVAAGSVGATNTRFPAYSKPKRLMLLRGQRSSQFFADVIRILSAEGYGVGNEFGNSAGSCFFSALDERRTAGKPLHRRLRAAQDLEMEFSSDKIRRMAWVEKNFESLKLAQVQQAHQRINISTLQINIEDRAGRPGIGKRAHSGRKRSVSAGRGKH